MDSRNNNITIELKSYLPGKKEHHSTISTKDPLVAVNRKIPSGCAIF